MKKVIIVIVTGILVFIAVSLLMNRCTSVIRDSIENDTTKQIVDNNKKYDINASFSEYNLDYHSAMLDYILYIGENYVDIKFWKYVDISDVIKYYERWGKKENTGVDVINTIVYNAQKKIFSYMFKSNSDWTDLPITDNFRTKFSKAGSIANYYSLPEDLIDRGEQKGFSIFFTDNVPKGYESIEYRFLLFEDDKGYIDNIYYLGRNMEEYMSPDSIKLEIELDDVDVIKACVHEICVSEEYLMKGGDELTDFDDHISGMNNLSINYKYRDKVFRSNGILPIKDYLKDSLEVISYDENIKEAIVKIETEEKKVFYKIKLEIDNSFQLQNSKVEFYKEEIK